MDARRNHILRVGIDDAPPVPMQIGTPESGDFHGYEVDLLQKLAERLEFTIQYRRALWSVIVGELSSGSLDLVCSAVTVTAERAREIDFCSPHLKLALALVTRADLSADLDISASRVGVRQGTTAEAFLLHRSGGKEPAMLSESNVELYSALAGGMLDGVIDDSPIALHFSRAIPGLRYAYRFEGTAGEYAVMTRRGNTTLREQINATLAQMECDGTLPYLRRIWFGSENLFIA
jgi:ABC-type amino acid transport substrate-binding protein